jgi:hypothetical protein
MLNTDNLRDLVLDWSRSESEPNAIQIDAYLGDLYLGQRTYYATSMKSALRQARSYIDTHGSLN